MRHPSTATSRSGTCQMLTTCMACFWVRHVSTGNFAGIRGSIQGPKKLPCLTAHLDQYRARQHPFPHRSRHNPERSSRALLVHTSSFRGTDICAAGFASLTPHAFILRVIFRIKLALKLIKSKRSLFSPPIQRWRMSLTSVDRVSVNAPRSLFVIAIHCCFLPCR